MSSCSCSSSCLSYLQKMKTVQFSHFQGFPALDTFWGSCFSKSPPFTQMTQKEWFAEFLPPIFLQNECIWINKFYFSWKTSAPITKIAKYVMDWPMDKFHLWLFSLVRNFCLIVLMILLKTSWRLSTVGSASPLSWFLYSKFYYFLCPWFINLSLRKLVVPG